MINLKRVAFRHPRIELGDQCFADLKVFRLDVVGEENCHALITIVLKRHYIKELNEKSTVGLGFQVFFSVATKTSRAERDVLYPEGVNVIAVFPDTGINIWGQRTLQSQPSALDRVNVRRLMIFMEEAIAESSRFVVFEPNNPQTWRALKRLINPFLQNIKEKGGLYGYAVQCDEETNTPAVIDRNEMVCRIFVKPTKTAEFVELNFVLTTTGADFTEIFGA